VVVLDEDRVPLAEDLGHPLGEAAVGPLVVLVKVPPELHPLQEVVAEGPEDPVGEPPVVALPLLLR